MEGKAGFGRFEAVKGPALRLGGKPSETWRSPDGRPIIGFSGKRSSGMRILTVIAFVMTALGSMGASAQTMGGMPSQGGAAPAQRAAQKASCERDARLVYRIGRNVGDSSWQQHVKDTRKAYVQDCMAKAGFTP